MRQLVLTLALATLAAPAMAQEPSPEAKDPAHAQTLALIPGAGYFYVEQPATGVMAAVAIGFNMAWLLTDEECNRFGVCEKPSRRGVVMGLIGAVAWAYSILDSGEQARKFNQEHGLTPEIRGGPGGSVSIGASWRMGGAS